MLKGLVRLRAQIYVVAGMVTAIFLLLVDLVACMPELKYGSPPCGYDSADCDSADTEVDSVRESDSALDSDELIDADGDGFGASEDCDDDNAQVYPGAPETDCTDPVDYNCDGSTGYADADADGVPACQDCDDNNSEIYPEATEVCDEQDNDCDGAVDEGVATTFYSDIDGDGHGGSQFEVEACTQPIGFVASADDCDDDNAQVYPGAPELCDGQDNDCDGAEDTLGVWPLTASSVDTGPLGLNGTDTSVAYVAAHVGNGAFFNGSSSRVELPYTELQPTGGLTISLWMWPEMLHTGSSGWDCLVTSGSAVDSSNGYAVCLHNKNLSFCTDDGTSAGNCLEDGGGYSSGDWHHVVVTWDVSSGTRTIYVDNVITATDTGVAPATPVYDASIATTMGVDINAGNQAAAFNGTLDEVKLLSCPVSAAQVSSDYTSNWFF